MWGFLRVENEHLHIYGGGDDSRSDTDSGGQPLLPHEVEAMPSSSASTASSVVGSGPGSTGRDPIITAGVSGGGISGWERWSGGVSRVNGLDRLPYHRMDMASKHGGGVGVGSACDSPIKTWCLTRVSFFFFSLIVLFCSVPCLSFFALLACRRECF